MNRIVVSNWENRGSRMDEKLKKGKIFVWWTSILVEWMQRRPREF